MNEYDFRNGKFDTYLGELIGATREAKEALVIRRSSPAFDAGMTGAGVVLDHGAYFLASGNQRYRSFLYLKRSRVASYGLPKRHYFQCEKVKGGLPYVPSNQDLVNITCSETLKFYKKVSLDVCGYCESIFKEKTTKDLTGKSFADFILDMEESEDKETRTDKNGYTLNWQEISTAYRKTKNFKCEKCGLQIADPEFQHFMHVHHRVAYEKTNNKRSNLQCLCIECHSQVDDPHKKNFSTIEQQRLIREFRERFRNS
jgi:hypothetical protein